MLSRMSSSSNKKWIFHFMTIKGPWRRITVQAATGVPPGCVLFFFFYYFAMSNGYNAVESTCLHPDEVNHNHISRENKDIWECLRASAAILDQQRASLVLLRCAVVSRDITQPCAVAPFSLNAAAICGFPHLYWGVSSHGLSWSFTVFYGRLFYFQWGQLRFFNRGQLR